MMRKESTVVVSIRCPESIVKRDGRVVPFDLDRIENALGRCFGSLSRTPSTSTEELARRTVNIVSAKYDGTAPTVEGVQDIVEMVLQAAGEFETAKHYILYRAEHSKQREERPIPLDVSRAFDADDPYFPTALQRFQFLDKYSRWNAESGRRETWIETVDRAVDYLHELASPYADLGTDTYERIRRSILKMRVTPSMRLLAMAGAPARRDNTTIYNCSYQPVDSLDAFVEALLISMAGCGVGFSVEAKYVDQLPMVDRQRAGSPRLHLVEDSAEGWGDALRIGLSAWFDGQDVTFDYSLVRAAGAVLLTKGGRASGPEPLRLLLTFARERILARQGRRLRPIDAHDIMCVVGTAAVSGGVRRTAMISLFDADDVDMLSCKSGDFERDNSQRWNANNSMVWTGVATMDQATFVERFMAMVRSGRGEPGIFSRDAAREMIPERRDPNHEFGCNPCAEINLRPFGFCNLSAAIVRAGDTPEDLLDKVEVAAIIGTIQSLATHFPNLRPVWRQNCEAERLLGVDITGQQDNPKLLSARNLSAARERVVFTNQTFSARLGINRSAATTCVKPSGNTSQLVDCASGLHARWAPYYIRNVRVSASSALARVLKDAGTPMAPENNEDPVNPRTWVVSFPVKAPDSAITRTTRSAVEQCNWWLRNKIHWTEHNPSVTITYRPEEVLDLAVWVWEHREKIGGMAFLPAFDAKYDQLPYIQITKTEYEQRAAAFPGIDWSRIWRYEIDDQTKAAQELACSAGVCEIDA